MAQRRGSRTRTAVRVDGAARRALDARAHAIAAPDTLDECLELGAEARDIGRLTGSVERVVAAHSLRIVAQMMQGDLARPSTRSPPRPSSPRTFATP